MIKKIIKGIVEFLQYVMKSKSLGDMKPPLTDIKELEDLENDEK